MQVLNLLLPEPATVTNPEIFRKSPDFSKSAMVLVLDGEPHDCNCELGRLSDGLVFGTHEHAAVISEVKLKPSAGMRMLVEKEPRRARIVNLEVNAGRLSESVAVIEANLYRPGVYPVRIRRTSDADSF